MPLLEVSDVVVAYGAVRAVDRASVTAGAGEVTGLIGPNGAGKTTLFDVVSGMRRPDAGRVLLDGRDVTRLPAYRRARLGMARTFQQLEAFGSLSVADNVRTAAEFRRRWDRRAGEPAGVTAELVERAGLAPWADVRADAVPTGVARLLELARALAVRPRLLLLDEPSAGLSGPESAAFGALLGELAAGGCAVLMVEHDMDLVMGVCSLVHVLDNGRVIASGTPGEVRADPLVREAYLGRSRAGAA